MNLVFSASNKGATVLPLALLFWMNIVAYVLHVLEETVVPEVFVEKMRRLYFPSYDWQKFFGFNAILLTLNIIAVVLYESLPGSWIILPLALMIERVLNGMWHLGETIVTRKYSSGLLKSVIVWIVAYLLIRYALLKGQVTIEVFITACGVGLAIDLVMMVPTYLGAFRKMK